jgi:hypothetical protein
MLPPNFREMMRMNVVCFLLFLFARKMKMMGNAVPYSDRSVCRFPSALKLEDGFAPWMFAWLRMSKTENVSETEFFSVSNFPFVTASNAQRGKMSLSRCSVTAHHETC